MIVSSTVPQMPIITGTIIPTITCTMWSSIGRRRRRCHFDDLAVLWWRKVLFTWRLRRLLIGRRGAYRPQRDVNWRRCLQNALNVDHIQLWYGHTFHRYQLVADLHTYITTITTARSRPSLHGRQGVYPPSYTCPTQWYNLE